MSKLNEKKVLYLFLAKRDKTGIRLLAKFLSNVLLPTRINDVYDLNLSSNLTLQINQIVYDNRMNWELWAESIDSFEDFRKSLKNRGYQNIPISPQPELNVSSKENQLISFNKLTKVKTMLRKN